MRFAPGGDVVVIVAIRDRAANDKEQDLGQRMHDPADIARIVDRGEVLQKN